LNDSPALLLARQPIYDASLEVCAFELLFRTSSQEHANVIDGDMASSRVLLHAFAGDGLRRITGGKPALINFTSHLIINPPPLDPAQLIIEVLEHIEPSETVLQSLQTLKAQGFSIALDDFVYRPELEPLIELADIIKLDVLELGLVGLRQQVRLLRNYPVKLLAEKIEDWNTFNECTDLGCALFQGYFLSRPQAVHGQEAQIAGNTLTQIKYELLNENTDINRLGDAIKLDPLLSYQLIKLVNSVLYRPALPIETLPRAIHYLGLEKVRGWLLLLTFSKTSDKPRELTRMTLARARMCALLGTAAQQQADRCFTMGVLSTLDAYLNLPMAEALTGSALSPEMFSALVDGDGQLGTLLRTAIDFERGLFEKLDWTQLEAMGCDQRTIESAYLDSLEWSQLTLQALSLAPPAMHPTGGDQTAS